MSSADSGKPKGTVHGPFNNKAGGGLLKLAVLFRRCEPSIFFVNLDEGFE